MTPPNPQSAGTAASSSDPANQNTSLTIDDVKNIITQAQAGGGDPVSVGMKIFDQLGDNIAVAGDILRQALAASNIAVAGPLSALTAAIQGVTKTGSQVTVTNTGQTQTEISGTPIRFNPTVTFNVGTQDGFPTISSIQGAAAHKMFWFGISELQLQENQGKRTLHVVTSGGARDFPLP